MMKVTSTATELEAILGPTSLRKEKKKLAMQRMLQCRLLYSGYFIDKTKPVLFGKLQPSTPGAFSVMINSAPINSEPMIVTLARRDRVGRTGMKYL